jgi:hypothetical protein
MGLDEAEVVNGDADQRAGQSEANADPFVTAFDQWRPRFRPFGVGQTAGGWELKPSKIRGGSR